MLRLERLETIIRRGVTLDEERHLLKIGAGVVCV